jgi:hypothetical protein
LANSDIQNQVFNFTIFINNQFSTSYEKPKIWLEVFSILQKGLTKIEGERILFLEELPWFDTKKSDFMTGRYFFLEFLGKLLKRTKAFCVRLGSFLDDKQAYSKQRRMT